MNIIDLSGARLLLHICCAPDATVPWPSLIGEGCEAVGYFYGANIHPRDEYDRRAEAVGALSAHTGAPVFMAEYAPERWLAAVRGLEDEPERGARCAKCFEIQLSEAAAWGAEHGFTHLCTTLTISPHKDVKLINAIGARCASERGLVWLERVWRKNDGFKRSVAASRALGLYRQDYCGCRFSMRKALPVP